MNTYTPPEVWDYQSIKAKNGGTFGGTNRPTAGATHEKNLPVGDSPYQLYSLNTPNGIKVNILLQELKQLGAIIGYDAYKINIMAGDQFGSDFVKINPNSKIPALLDQSTTPATRIFESGAILLYLAQNITPLSQLISISYQNFTHGSCGRWVQHRLWAVVLVILCLCTRANGISY